MTSEPEPPGPPLDVPAKHEAAEVDVRKEQVPAEVAAQAEQVPAEVDERHLHPAATAIGALRHARSAGFAMLAVIASQGLKVGLLIVLALVLAGAALAFLEWRSTRYAVVDGALRLKSGVFARKEQFIQASRISALDTSRGILQRIFGVVAVQVQTAGGQKDGDLVLRAVTFKEAERLRRELGHRSGHLIPATTAPAGDAAQASGGGDGASPADPQRPTFTSPTALADDAPVVYAITPRELVVTALTSPSVAVVGAAGAAIFSAAQDALPDGLQRQVSDSIENVNPATGFIVLGVLIILAALVSVVGTVVMYGGFRVTRDERRLRVRRGLLTERVGTVPLDRIHGVRIIESPLRQALGYASIEVEVAGYAGQDEVTRTLIPLVRRAELPEVLRQVVPGYEWPTEPLQGVPFRARRRYLTWPLVIAVPLGIALAVVIPVDPLRLVGLLPILIAVAYGRWTARDAGWQLDDVTLTLRWRTFGRSTLLAHVARLQRAESSTSPFQRRVALANFAVRLANAREARVRHLDEVVVHALVARSGH